MILVMGFDLAIYIQQHKHNGFLQLHSFPDNLKMKFNVHVPLPYMEEIFYGLHQALKGRERERGGGGGGGGGGDEGGGGGGGGSVRPKN